MVLDQSCDVDTVALSEDQSSYIPSVRHVVRAEARVLIRSVLRTALLSTVMKSCLLAFLMSSNSSLFSVSYPLESM